MCVCAELASMSVCVSVFVLCTPSTEVEESLEQVRFQTTEVGYSKGAYLYMQQRLLAAPITHENSHQTPI